MPSRASYHVRKRTLSWTGEFDKQIVPSTLKDILATKSEQDAIPACWSAWEKHLKDSKVKAVRSQRSLTLQWQHGLTIQTYDQPIACKKTPWPVIADLHTDNYSLRLGKTKKGSTPVHILHHTILKEETPFRILVPLSRMDQWSNRLIVLAKWTTERVGTTVIYKIQDTGFGDNYELILDHATRLPKAVLVGNSTAALYSWKKVGNKTLWLDSVLQVQRGEDIPSGDDRIQVSWTQVDKVTWNGKVPIQIPWPLPTTILDTRGGRNRTTVFEAKALPRELQELPWPALSANVEKTEKKRSKRPEVPNGFPARSVALANCNPPGCY